VWAHFNLRGIYRRSRCWQRCWRSVWTAPAASRSQRARTACLARTMAPVLLVLILAPGMRGCFFCAAMALRARVAAVVGMRRCLQEVRHRRHKQRRQHHGNGDPRHGRPFWRHVPDRVLLLHERSERQHEDGGVGTRQLLHVGAAAGVRCGDDVVTVASRVCSYRRHGACPGGFRACTVTSDDDVCVCCASRHVAWPRLASRCGDVRAGHTVRDRTPATTTLSLGQFPTARTTQTRCSSCAAAQTRRASTRRASPSR
jgi:hypothetical protein